MIRLGAAWEKCSWRPPLWQGERGMLTGGLWAVHSLKTWGKWLYLFSSSSAWRFASHDREKNVAEAAKREAVDAKAAQLLEKYGNNILRLAYTYLHNRDDAEEILQETLIQFLRNAPTFVSSAHEKAWLLRVAGNLSKNRIVYNKIRATNELNEELAAEQREDLAFVWEAVSNLPVQYREAVHLFYYEGYSTGEIAKILGQNQSTVRSNLRRGRQQLKNILREEYSFEGGL